jgi:endogenous inhibitor of DNA gyrase (YacG/DUF329 family)
MANCATCGRGPVVIALDPQPVLCSACRIAELERWQREAVLLLFRGADLTGFGFHARTAVRNLLERAGTSWDEQDRLRDAAGDGHWRQ